MRIHWRRNLGVSGFYKTMIHKSVLLQETVDALHFQSGDILLDCTINGGGHSSFIAKTFGKTIRIIGLDLDASALKRAEAKLQALGADFILRQSSFRNLDLVLKECKVEKIHKVLFDLGLSSNQLEESGRGFSFKKDESLGMTFSETPTEAEITADEIVNTWDEEHIADIIFGYGEEQFARRIAKKIVSERVVRPIKTTFELTETIGRALPEWYKRRKIHFATKTFQALRIAVNDELNALKDGLEKAFDVLALEGIMAVISFHSLEDRIVKHFLRAKVAEGLAELPFRKPIISGEKELAENSRARSAKLRVIIKSLSAI